MTDRQSGLDRFYGLMDDLSARIGGPHRLDEPRTRDAHPSGWAVLLLRARRGPTKRHARESCESGHTPSPGQARRPCGAD